MISSVVKKEDIFMSEVVSKKDLIEKMAEDCGVSKKDATTYVKFLLDEITNTLVQKGTVDLNGFGKFTVTERAARKGINPLTKESIEIPASNAVKFKPSKTLKDAVK